MQPLSKCNTRYLASSRQSPSKRLANGSGPERFLSGAVLVLMQWMLDSFTSA